MKKLRIVAIMLCSLALCLTIPLGVLANGAEVDQSSYLPAPDPSSWGMNTISFMSYAGQQFIPSMSPLVGVEVFLAAWNPQLGAANVTVKIHEDEMYGTIIAQKTMLLAADYPLHDWIIPAYGGLVYFEFDSAVAVDIGRTYIIQVGSDTGTHAWTSGWDLYPNGGGLFDFGIYPTTDWIFQTYTLSSNIPPIADANGPYSGIEGSSIALDGSGSYDSDGSVVLYEWDFDNDGVYDYSSTTSDATYPSSSAGIYDLVLRVTDDGGLTDTGSTTVEVLTPAEAVENTLEEIEEAVEGGSLEGSGPGQSADKRLGALINMVENALDLIDTGEIDEAIIQLEAAYGKCDGNPRPKDLVTGPAADDLASSIQDILASLAS